ncbi:MAG: hypothetical protein A2Y23_07825 [Clostridiales bacterium GWB2_37_7]|nr:MAG: hypothetical protein A2Y23_07825 [Clostridiales bacterium GWB2_37_7]
MFENRARKRNRNVVLLIITVILVSAFGFGYFLNFDGNTNINKDNKGQGDKIGFQIPNSIRNPEIVANADPIPNNEQLLTATPGNLITANTKIQFKTYFTLCGHLLDKDSVDIREFINLSEEDLKSKYPDWTVSEFSTQQVILKREIQTYCPKHFIISSKDGYIAIYVYNYDGVKTLYEMTDYPISILTNEDQSNLEYGIVAESEEELQQKLEGLSD